MKTILFSVFALLICTLSSHAQVTINASNYTTLKGAFDAINAGTHTGAITVTISATTNETVTATLNASGSGSASYTSVLIYPTASGCSIAGSIAGALISLNGADNVTLDGRVNQAGAMNLIVNNSSTSTSATAITFNNDACTNTVTYVNVKGSAPTINNNPDASSRGVIYFGSTAPASGSDGNTISYCNVGPSGSNLPGCGIFSYGSSTAGRENSGTIIDHCNIFDYFYDYTAGHSANTYDAGVFLAYYGNTSWTISNNSFYQTATRNKSNNNTYNNIAAIYIGSGDGYNISGNYIGGTQANCGGSAMTYTGNAYQFIPIKYRSGMVSRVNVNQINNNVISNISFSSGNTNNSTNNSVPRFAGLHFTDGKVSCSGNTVGSTSSNNSVILRQTNGTFSLYYFWSPISYSNYQINMTNCNNNTFAGITIDATYFDSEGIHLEPYTGNSFDSLSNNMLGSLSNANSIQIALSTASVTRNSFLGMYASSFTIGQRVISGNTIANISRGIGSTDGMTCLLSYTTDAIIRNNTIINIDGGNGGTIYGINSGGTNSTVEKNFIANLGSATSSSSNVYGIYNSASSGGSDIYNNVVVLGKDRSGNSYPARPFVGIQSGYGDYLSFNTVSISGNCTSNYSYAYYDNSSSTKTVSNNLFSNTRTNTSGTAKHYAAYFYGTTGLTSNYNNYYVAGTGGVLGYLAGDRATLAAIQTATGQDGGSINTNPAFYNPSGSYAIDYKPTTTLAGNTMAAVSTDYAGATRAATPTIGAFEYGINKWVGTSSTAFNVAANWSKNYVPISGESFEFDAAPSNHCILDQNRTQGSITNAQSTYDLKLNGFELTILGTFNFTNAAEIDATTAASGINFAGSAAQSIPADILAMGSIPNLKISNAAGVTMMSNLTLTNQLTFVSGVINTGAFTLNLADGATTSGSGTGKYINGTCQKTGNDAFIFPMGNGGRYGPISIGAPALVTDHFTASYTFANPHSLYNTTLKEGTLDHVCTNEYWILNRTGGSSNVSVTMYWNSCSGITTPADIRVARWNGSLWADEGNSAWAGDATSGWLTSDLISDFSPFTFASISAGNALPVELIEFNAVPTNSVVEVFWSTASETNSDRFEIERSADNFSWSTIGSANAAGNSTILQRYQFNDSNPLLGLSYYRLKQVDLDGKFTTSESVSVNFKSSEQLSIYPIPASQTLFIAGLNTEVKTTCQVFNAAGILVMQSDGIVGQIDISMLPQGMYWLKVIQENNTQSSFFIKE